MTGGARRMLLLVLTAALLFAPSVAQAAPPPRADYNAIEAQVMCPVCGVPLAIAEAPQARDEKRFIKDLIAQGLTEQQIKDRLVSEYGRSVLATPKASGFDLAAYLVPIAVVLALLGVVAFLVPRWRRREPPAPSAPGDGPAIGSDDAKRLDEDLARYV